MLQIEIYTNHLEENAAVFKSCFDFELVQEQTGFKKFNTGNIGSELMLFDPGLSTNLHWDITNQTNLGKGVEIIIVINGIENILQKIKDFGYSTTDLVKKPWGSTEFEFNLKDGYLIRVKQI